MINGANTAIPNYEPELEPGIEERVGHPEERDQAVILSEASGSHLVPQTDPDGQASPSLRMTVRQDDTRNKKDDYIQAFIDNKMVRDVFPHMMNWLNIGGNVFSFASSILNFGEGPKKFAQQVGSFSTKAFLVATSVINIVERMYTKNYLSALGYLNDILIAGTVEQRNTYLARGIASGTYNMANAFNIANDREGKSFDSFEDHLQHLVTGFGKFFKNLFSPNIVQNFMDSKKGMWASFGGIFANIGALSWMFTGKEQLPTFIRDIAGVLMDIEQLNFGHYKAGHKDFFKSGVALVIGTMADWLSKLMPSYKDALVPLTFIADGIGRHWLRLHQNEYEMGDKKARRGSLALEAA
ncbi:MAG: hypothetical protein OXU45_03625 [Candidatus Melainabacteria bacterium]|nr:hypothetical protein [Candidatus Melainabacteria bacterium]